jgi:hypothetical protein
MTINTSAITADPETLSVSPLNSAGHSPAPSRLPWASSAASSSHDTRPLHVLLGKLWTWVRKIQIRQSNKRLRVCETVPLGERRFIAVIQVDNKQFLVGGSSNSVSLLAQLDKPENFSSAQNKIAEVNSQA